MAISPSAIETTETPPQAAGPLLLGVCPPTFVAMTNALALSPFFSVLALDLHASVALLGQVPALMNALAAAFGLIAGPLAERFGYRRILLAATLAAGVSGLITASTPVVAGLFLAAVFGGASRSVVSSLSLAIVGTRLSGDVGRRALSWVVMAMGTSVLLGPAIMTALGTWFGWRGAFVALAGGATLIAWATARLLPADGPFVAKLYLRGVLHTYGPVVRHRGVLGLYAGALLRNTTIWTLGVYMGAFLVERRALSLQEVGLAFTVIGVGMLAGSFLFGGRLGGLPLRPLLASLYLLLGVLLAAFLVLPMPLLPAMVLLGITFVLNAGADVLEAVLLTRETPGGKATTMALYGTAKSSGTALAGALGGLLILLGSYEALGLALPVLGAGAAVCIGVLRQARQLGTPV